MPENGICTALRSAAAAALLTGIAVDALLHRRIAFMRADAHNIQCAEILAAQIVTALIHGAVDIGVLVLLHPVFLLPAAEWMIAV